jgi:hypothetical protein
MAPNDRIIQKIGVVCSVPNFGLIGPLLATELTGLQDLAELEGGPTGCRNVNGVGVYLLGTSVWQGQL